MTESRQSNPFSTGGGGSNFETRVQAAFTVLMLTGRISPCLPPFPITKLKLQGRYAGFNTDDFIVFSKQPNTEKEAKLFAQIKHEIGITIGDKVFAEVIHSAWNDFNSKGFDPSTDAFALITGPLSATDINSVRPILEWARHSENEEEFLVKINTADFSSDTKREKLEAFKTHLKTANDETDLSDKQLWEFLKVFHLIGYDLDIESGSTLSLIQSLIAQFSDKAPLLLWTRVVDAVQTANQNAGTLTLETLPEDLQAAFSTVGFSDWLADLKKLKDHGNYILEGIRTKIGEVHVKQSDAFFKLINMTEASHFIFVTGERGSGKSSLIRDFSDHINKHSPIFCLRTEDLDEAHIDNVFSTMGLKGSLSDLETGFALMPKKYLVIESFEKLLELENTNAFTDLLHLLDKEQGWIVIATGRDYAYQQITFHYLQPFGISFETLLLDGFSDEQVESLCEQLEPLRKLSGIPTLKRLIKSPFFADLAFRVLETGTEFAPDDGEKEFRVAVWRDVIAKEQERKNGMPIKRKQIFINIAVKRAKQMVYGVPETEFDSEVIFMLEEDSLVRRDSKNGLVSPAHDVLEDWALEQYIEDIFKKYSGNAQDFLNAIGSEPAINRAFRLWLHQKLRYGENVNDFVSSVLNAQGIQRYWQDETIAAILQGDNPDEFLKLLKDQLFIDDGELLKRFCFILRITCQTPDQTLTARPKTTTDERLVDILYLKPYGQGWRAIICFLFDNRDHLSEILLPHVIAVLNDWTSVLHIDKALPIPAREAGLLALNLLNGFKESYRDDGDDRKKLLGVIIKTVSAIHTEFIELLETDVFIPMTGSRSRKRQHRLHYVDDFCEMVFSLVESAFLSKHDPDILIKLANFEWMFDPSSEDDEPWYSRSRIDVAECFGFHEYRYEFFPPSGMQGPFHNLLRYHPRKGLDFILDLLNKAADKYAHSDLDSPRDSSSLKTGYSEPLVPQVEIHLNDESSVKQYCSGRLWPAYRGNTVVPYLLQSALMALENWLIVYAEYSESDRLEWLFDYILRNSNSVMPTAVLASIAIGFPEKIGKSALPLLRTPELYFMDSGRAIQEQIGINWSGAGFQRDLFSEIHAEDRRTAALRPWIKKDLEMLIKELQFSKFRDDALSVIDTLRASAPESEEMRFLFHRIDSRGWKVVEDKENNRIIFESESLEPDLAEIQQKTQEEVQINNRFMSLWVWATKTLKHEHLDSDYYTKWSDALDEAKELFEKLKNGIVKNLSAMYYGGIVTAAAVFVRDNSSELAEENLTWCIEFIIKAVTANADTNNSLAIADATDFDGAAAASSVLPILLDFASSKKEELIVRRLIATALTHVNGNVRHGAADGIREHLWQRDPEFAQQCIIGAIEYARLEKNIQTKKRRAYFEDDAKETERVKLIAKRTKFRNRLARGGLSNQAGSISLRTHSSWHILTPCLMIPDGSKKPEHIELFSQMLTLFFQAEQNKHKYRTGKDKKLEIDYKIPLDFTKRFAKHLYSLQETAFEDYIEQLRAGCDTAPDFMHYLVLCVAVEVEKTGQRETYWKLWEELSTNVQGIANEIAQHDSDDRRSDERTKLIRGMLKADLDWQEIDFENQDIAYGKDLILEFATNTGKNPDVFEALAKLMHYFPSIFFESGIHILSKHQKEESGVRLLSGINTAFYLERSIQRFLQLNQTGSLPRNMHESCFVLLDAIVETASSRAYYLREHLIRSRRII